MDFSKKLINWYQENKRNLPWRNTSNPYKIWISEIILQQTRVKQGWDYYLNFIERFPDVQSLAAASEQEVLKQWQGLGYYSRARNLHKAAQCIVSDFAGKFPDDYQSVLSLKGIGEYTASAICSIAYQQPYPVVDGNVLRVISRVFGIHDPVDSAKGKDKIRAKLIHLLDKENPSDFNQGLMELGAMICKPKSPDCPNCVFSNNCIAFELDQVEKLPVKTKKTKSRNRFFNYLVILQFMEDGKSKIILKNRMDKDIWKGLIDFPLFESDKKPTFASVISRIENKMVGIDYKILQHSEVRKHVLTHQTIYAQFHQINIEGKNGISKHWLKSHGYFAIDFESLSSFPVPRLIDSFIKDEFVNY